jgi:hypothetical protein
MWWLFSASIDVLSARDKRVVSQNGTGEKTVICILTQTHVLQKKEGLPNTCRDTPPIWYFSATQISWNHGMSRGHESFIYYTAIKWFVKRSLCVCISSLFIVPGYASQLSYRIHVPAFTFTNFASSRMNLNFQPNRFSPIDSWLLNSLVFSYHCNFGDHNRAVA